MKNKKKASWYIFVPREEETSFLILCLRAKKRANTTANKITLFSIWRCVNCKSWKNIHKPKITENAVDGLLRTLKKKNRHKKNIMIRKISSIASYVNNMYFPLWTVFFGFFSQADNEEELHIRGLLRGADCMLCTDLQYTPVLSMAITWQPCSYNHS